MLGILGCYTVTVSRWLLCLLVVIPSSSIQNSLFSAAGRHVCLDFWISGQSLYLIGFYVFLL